MISFSGIDCSGKSTQIKNIVENLKQNNTKCRVIWSRGGYTPLLESVKKLVRPDKGKTEEEHAAYRAKVHGNQKQRKLLLWLSVFDLALYYGIYFRIVNARSLIIADRYIWDSYIDFKIKYPEFDFEHWQIWKILNKIYLKPQLSFVYIVSAEESVYRSTLKEEPFPEPVEVRRFRIEKYMQEIEKHRWQFVIDASKPVEEVFRETMEIIRNENIRDDIAGGFL